MANLEESANGLEKGYDESGTFKDVEGEFDKIKAQLPILAEALVEKRREYGSLNIELDDLKERVERAEEAYQHQKEKGGKRDGKNKNS